MLKFQQFISSRPYDGISLYILYDDRYMSKALLSNTCLYAHDLMVKVFDSDLYVKFLYIYLRLFDEFGL